MKLRFLSWLLLAAALAGCTPKVDEKAAVATAQAFIDKREHKSAVISTKSALQTLPDSGALRGLLGQALLESGDPAAAAVELRKARELGLAETTVAPALAKALLAQREARQVVAQFAALRLDDAAASAELKTTVAAAHALLDEREAALESLNAALSEWPQHAGAKLLKAQLAAIAGNGSEAMALVDEVLAQDAANVNALIYKGDLLRGFKRDDEAALTSYRAAAAAAPKPGSTAAGVAIVSLLMQQRRLPQAEEDFKRLKAFAPSHPDTRLLEAQLAYLAKDYVKAREIATPLLKVLPAHVPLLQLAGDTELRLNALGAAENYLTQAVKAAPQAVSPRRSLAQLYVRSGQAPRALEILQPVLASPSADSTSLALAGQALLQEGDAAGSEAMFARAARQDPKNTVARTALALNKMAKGQIDGGFADLEAAAAADAGERADLALIAARMRSRDFAGALRAIDALQQKQPQLPLPHVLRGRVLLAQKDTAGAVASFESALRADPQHFAATASLASLDLAAGKPEAAQQRFAAALKADPKNFRLLLGLADMKARTGGTKAEVTKLIGDATRAHPGEPAPRLMLVRYLLQQQDAKAAMAAAQEAHVALPASTDVLHQLGTAQLAAGQPAQAIASFVKLAAALPTRAEPELALADAHVAAKDLTAARRSLERALALQPKAQTAQAARFGLARVAVMQKRHDEAVKSARALQQADPRSAAAFALEAEAELDRGNAAAAVGPLRTALQLAPRAEVAISLHRVLLGLGRKDDAERLSGSWRKDHPQDPLFFFYLGDAALANAQYAAAEAEYRKVTALQPQNALALNNIAWLMTRQQKAGAVAVAEQANQLLPNRAPLMDTLAWALANENQLPRAVDVQKKAIAAAPGDVALKLTLAKIYLKSGDLPHARAELDELARLGNKFAAHAEVAELLKTVQ